MATMMIKEDLQRDTIHKNNPNDFRKRAIKPYKHYQHADILNVAAKAANKYLHIDGDK